ncbi:MAG: tyrosine--tRNA ligase [Bacteriovoracaceae bacterium]|nr:tyrosine--tRNA ligase [Bacteriovoracaceae bacterium]
MKDEQWVEVEYKRQLEILKFGVVEITPVEEFEQMLKKSIATQIPLVVKCGIDPTGSDVHLGHLVPYKKMRQFQDLGHKGVVIIGDYTASIGDPTGRNESRPSLSMEAIKENASQYMEQLFTVLDRDKTEIRFQSEWFSDVSLKDVIKWASGVTVAKLLGHETFRDRLDQGVSVSLHELFYPVLQGIDSVYIKADVELGGTDQKFNVLMGRDYLKIADLRPQVAMLLPIITGTCGTQKMSKSLGNYIGIKEEPFEKFGKLMSIPDNLMLEYYQFVAGLTPKEFEKLKNDLEQELLHPNMAKKELASKVVSFFHGEQMGLQMRQKFENVFSKKKLPDDIPEFEFKRGADLVTILSDAGVLSSKGEGRRLVKQNAVSFFDADKVNDAQMILDESHVGKVLKIGKRKFLRLK